MNNDLLEDLLNESESNYLDFKRDQYRFDGGTDEEKSELLKDILAFANAWRRTDAYILIGVEEVRGGRSNVVGVESHLADNSLQEFVNSKTQRRLLFSCETFPIEEKKIDIIHIPLQERPFYLNRHYGKVKEQTVYVRQGSSTAIAKPDDIASMGRVRQDEINYRIELQSLVEELAGLVNFPLDEYYIRYNPIPFEQYERLFDKGVIARLDDDIRLPLKNVYNEIKAIDYLCKSGWANGNSSSGVEALNAGRRKIIDVQPKAKSVLITLNQYLDQFRR